MLEKFKARNEWRKDGGGAIIVAHPDDEILIAWGVINLLADVGIPVSVITLTMGELGETADKPDLKPEEMRKIRETEFHSSSKVLGVTPVSFPFPDSELSNYRIKEKAKKEVLNHLRKKRYGVIFSFHPFEVTQEFYHLDHNASGEIASHGANSTAVKNLHTKASPMESRPSLFLWTSDPRLATCQILYSRESEIRRKKHLETYYPSQFPHGSLRTWGTIFDRIAKGSRGNLHPGERFLQVR